MQPFRIEPVLPPQAMKTYQILAPVESHFRDATCAEADCPAFLHGWATAVNEATELGQRQAHYIRKLSGRAFVEARHEAGLTTFTFEAGQRCFGEHKVPLGRPEIFVVRDGDWRRSANPRRHANADDWVDDFATHQLRLADQIQRG